jgi:hypothetical protein
VNKKNSLEVSTCSCSRGERGGEKQQQGVNNGQLRKKKKRKKKRLQHISRERAGSFVHKWNNNSKLSSSTPPKRVQG